MGAPVVTLVDLDALALEPGASATLSVDGAVSTVLAGGLEYRPECDVVTAQVAITRSLSGWHATIAADTALRGPCWRCLASARVVVRARAGEFQSAGRTGAAFDEDLDSPYFDTGPHALDVGAWLHDAVAGELPSAILCREECAGLCPSCGADRNARACDCAPGPPPRGPFWGLAERVGPSAPGAGGEATA
ncbi:MAG: DUF177 domain-containing protein [Actinobacteria bacterium]|nr:DUF177 domain-containing protein [Actinomycetota bacterium]